MLQIHGKRDAAPAFIPDFGDPLGLLVHCHRKIEAHLGALVTADAVLRTGDAAARAQALRAVEAARAHFEGPGTKHTADEEESLFPRLRAREGAAESGVLAALDELESQHRVIERAHAELDTVIARLGAAPSAGDVEEFGGRASDLVRLYRPHIDLENDLVFPAAARLLPPDQLAALGQEMRARRGR